jgi:hypothetical protein
MSEREDYKIAFWILMMMFVISFIANLSFIYIFANGQPSENSRRAEPKQELFQNCEADTNIIE